MPRNFKLGALLISALCAVFFLFFENSKHDPLFRPLNPFGEDPYDATGSFAIQAALFLAALILFRAFRSYAPPGPSETDRALLLRAEMIATLAIAITTAADWVAMLRHQSLWAGFAAGHLLLRHLALMTAVSAAAGAAIYRAGCTLALPTVPRLWPRAWLISLAALAMFLFYPEQLRRTLPGELFTVFVGIVLLFAPMGWLGAALIPHRFVEAASSSDGFPSRTLRRFRIPLVLSVALAAGLALVWRELTDGGASPRANSRMLLVVAVYVGIETTGVLTGYLFLRKPLGLFREQARPSE